MTKETDTDQNLSEELDFGEFEVIKFELRDEKLPEVWGTYGIYIPPTFSCP